VFLRNLSSGRKEIEQLIFYENGNQTRFYGNATKASPTEKEWTITHIPIDGLMSAGARAGRLWTKFHRTAGIPDQS
jgi:hypothetical protein